jgi:hypothetical protein
MSAEAYHESEKMQIEEDKICKNCGKKNGNHNAWGECLGEVIDGHLAHLVLGTNFEEKTGE